MPHPPVPASSVPPRVLAGQRFVGTVQANNLTALATAVACQPNGEIVLLALTGPKTTASAIVATLHAGGKTRKPISFEPAFDVEWNGPTLLYRMQELGSHWISSTVEPTTYLHVAVLARAASVDYCRQHPIPQPIEEAHPVQSAASSQPSTARLRPKRPLPPSRFVLASEGETHPDWQTFTGLMRSLWLPFPLSFAPLLWEAGRQERFILREDEETALDMEREHTLIEPVACSAGIHAWQILPSRQWSTLLERLALQTHTQGL